MRAMESVCICTEMIVKQREKKRVREKGGIARLQYYAKDGASEKTQDQACRL